jgi:hypothetical protein
MMNNNHITIFVELSEQEKLLEQGLEQRRQECMGKVDTAIEHGDPIKEFNDLDEELRCSIRDLKGGVYAPSGLKTPKNSTELAQGVLLKAQKVAHLEDTFIDGQLGDCRDKMQSIKTRIESIILFCIEHHLDQKFDDFKWIIKRWEHEKTDIFEKPERCEPAYGVNHIPMLEKNLIGYYINKLRHIQFLIGELNYNKINRTQVGALISICDIVKVSDDDNRIFDQLFLMGQYVGNLNNIESNLNGLIAKQRSERSATSKADWGHELGQSLYLEHWINNDYPATLVVLADLDSGKYRHLKEDNKNLEREGKKRAKVHDKTMEKVIREQRLLYSKIDPRITLPQQGRPKNKIK